MNKNRQKNNDKSSRMLGFSVVELIIVVLLIAILAAVGIPELIQTRKAWRFVGMQQQLVASLRQARQTALSQNRRIAFEYNDTTKITRIYDIDTRPFPTGVNGYLGPINDSRNIVVNLSGESLAIDDIVYGAPPSAPTTLIDTSELTPLTGGDSGTVAVYFSPRGDAIQIPPAPAPSGAPWNYALFFYNRDGNSSAFAISILGPGGRVRVWNYDGTVYE